MKLFILIILCFFYHHSYSQPQVTISLYVDSGVKQSKHLYFRIVGVSGNSHEFIYDDFSNDGWYANHHQFQYSQEIHAGQYQVLVTHSTGNGYSISDSLFIDSNTSRVDIQLYVGTKDATQDYIRLMKTVRSLAPERSLKIMPPQNASAGSAAFFGIQNTGIADVFSYPHPRIFFGRLYEKTNNREVVHYPRQPELPLCNTAVDPQPLRPGSETTAYVPVSEDCTPYYFTRNGRYVFEMFYAFRPATEQKLPEGTVLHRADIYRQVLDFQF